MKKGLLVMLFLVGFTFIFSAIAVGYSSSDNKFLSFEKSCDCLFSWDFWNILSGDKCLDSDSLGLPAFNQSRLPEAPALPPKPSVPVGFD